MLASKLEFDHELQYTYYKDVICIPRARARSFRRPGLLSSRMCVGEKQMASAAALPFGRQRRVSRSSDTDGGRAKGDDAPDALRALPFEERALPSLMCRELFSGDDVLLSLRAYCHALR